MQIYYGWWILAVILLASMAVFGVMQNSFGVFVHPVSAEYGFTRTQANAGMILYLAGGAFWNPVLGPMFDRFSIRYLMTIGALTFGASLAAIGLTKSVWVIALLLAGPVAAGGAMIGQLVIGVSITRWFQRNRAKCLGFAFAAISLGGVWIPGLTGRLIAALGWRQTLIVEGVTLGFVVAAVSFLFMRNSPAELGIQMEGTGDGKVATQIDHETATRVWTVPDLLSCREFWLVTMAVVLIYAFDGMFLASFIPYAVDMGLDVSAATFIFACFNVSAIFGKLLSGLLIERFEKRHLFVAMAIGNAVMAITMILQPSYLVLLLICSIVGFAFGNIGTLWTVLTGDYFGRRSYGAVMGVMTFLVLTATIAAIFFAGVIFDKTGSYNAAFVVFTIGVFVSVVLIHLVGEPEEMKRAKDAAVTASD